jgi:hypothetical protein
MPRRRGGGPGGGGVMRALARMCSGTSSACWRRSRHPGNLGQWESRLSVNCFTPGDRQAPISLRCVEPSHMGNLGLDWPPFPIERGNFSEWQMGIGDSQDERHCLARCEKCHSGFVDAPSESGRTSSTRIVGTQPRSCNASGGFQRVLPPEALACRQIALADFTRFG